MVEESFEAFVWTGGNRSSDLRYGVEKMNISRDRISKAKFRQKTGI